MNGKMQALQALLEMLSKMDLDRMAPQDGAMKVEMELGDDSQEMGLGDQPDQADKILERQVGDKEAPLGERSLSPEAMLEGDPSEGDGADEEELKKLYSSLD